MSERKPKAHLQGMILTLSNGDSISIKVDLSEKRKGMDIILEYGDGTIKLPFEHTKKTCQEIVELIDMVEDNALLKNYV